MKLIWHADNLLEEDWIRSVLAGLYDNEVMDLDLTCFDDEAIHVVSSNWLPLPAYETYFGECRRRCTRLILFHTSDEWYSGGYALYRHFDLVIRNFWTSLATAPGIMTIPEGYSNGTRAGEHLRPVAERRYAWSFTGQIKASRLDMASAFDGLEPKLLTATSSIYHSAGKKLSKGEFDSILEDSVFSPCPMGNAILETWRLYESLEMGCIPLVEHRPFLDYFRQMFGPNPIPSFRSWTAARRYVEAALGNPTELAGKQDEIHRWWTGYKDTARIRVRTAIDGPSHASALRRYGALARNRMPLLHEPLRLAELLRHQNGSSLRRRLMRPQGPIKRILRESLRGFFQQA